MRFLNSILAIVTMLLACVWSELQAGTIYDNTTTRQGMSLNFTKLQQGSEVNADGTERFVTDLFVGMSQQGVAGTADMQARLYANNGAGGKPGTLLWEGPLLKKVDLTGGIDLIDFSVPMVLVPDTFTWTVQISNPDPVAVGLPNFGPPTVGSSVTNWFGDGTVWTPLSGDGFEARVEAVSAVPEPSTALLLIAGSGLVLCGRVCAGRHGRFSIAGAACS
jgi:hypothetical protein